MLEVVGMVTKKNPESEPGLLQVAGIRHFNEAAATWDENPHRRQLTEAIARSIGSTLPLQPDWRVLEYGCGTAALSFLLASQVREVVAADAAPGMVEQIRRKLTVYPTTKVKPLLLDLTQEAALTERFDLILMAMALHHITDVPELLSRLGSMLADRGWLAIADLQAEDGSFHTPQTVPHNGFAPKALAQSITVSLGEVSCTWRIVHEIPKNGRLYPVCLWAAQKR